MQGAGESRKASRKRRREEKKLRRARSGQRAHDGGPRRRGVDNDDDDEHDDDDQGDDLGRGSGGSRKRATPRAKRPKPTVSVALPDPENEELRYLREKLGLGQGKSKDKWEKSKRKLLRELEEDGFGADLLEFLHLGDEKSPFLQSSSGPAVDGEAESEAESESESVSEAGAESADPASDQDPSESSEVDQQDAQAQGPVHYLPKANIYGDNNVEHSGERATKQLTWAEARKLRSSTGNAAAGDSTNDKLRRHVRGLLNRVAEANVQPITTELEGLFTQHSSTVLGALLAEEAQNLVCNEVVLLHSLGTALVALVAALSCRVRSEVGAVFVEAAVKRFEREHATTEVATVGAQPLSHKRSANIALLVVHAYTFGLVHHGLVLDLLDRLVAPPKRSLTALDIAVFQAVLDESALRLRGEDRERFTAVLSRARDMVASSSLASAVETADDQGARQHFARGLGDLLQQSGKRTAKPMHERMLERTSRLRKWVRHVASGNDSHMVALHVSWDEFRQADNLGRWWIVGGVWGGQRQDNSSGGGGASASSSNASLRGRGNPVSDALARADGTVLKLAKKHRMNTDVRKALFCGIMGASDYAEAFDQVLRLSLNDRQEREIVHVLVYCCRSSKRYNPYFHHLARRLCTYHPRFKFTFQLALWDIFKELSGASPPRATDDAGQSAANAAHLFAFLIGSFSLSLAVLKAVEFGHLTVLGRDFFLILFRDLLGWGGPGKDGAMVVAKAVNRLGQSNDAGSVRDGILLFLHHHERDLVGQDELIRKRLKVMRRVLAAVL